MGQLNMHGQQLIPKGNMKIIHFGPLYPKYVEDGHKDIQ